MMFYGCVCVCVCVGGVSWRRQVLRRGVGSRSPLIVPVHIKGMVDVCGGFQRFYREL
jgi:hypothetical protein